MTQGAAPSIVLLHGLGRTRYSNLLLNIGHGALGFTLACGCGRIMADLAAGRKPEISLDGFTLA